MKNFLNDETWAIVELFGHTQIAGRISEQEIAGQMFLRVDVPDAGETKGFTRFFGASAIYSITPIDETVARKACDALKKTPVTVWGVIGPERQLEMPFDDEYEDDECDDDEVPF